MIWQKEITLPSKKRGHHLVTDYIEKELPENTFGLLNIFIKHTSAGLTINENAAPSVREDFNSTFDKLVPENASHYTHTLEGPDDMPAHIKSSLVGCSHNVPVNDGRLMLGRWQGVYLCEYRNTPSSRKIQLTLIY